LIKAVYLLFAVVHPITELLSGTNLRIFLNRVYYKKNRDDFPVSKSRGTVGSLAVLVLLVAALLGRRFGVDWWCLALGLALADVVQHVTHFALRPRQAAPRIHLITILGVALFLPWMNRDGKLDLLEPVCRWPLVVGALIILGNWGYNSWRARWGQ
jgi:hypothetical protein